MEEDAFRKIVEEEWARVPASYRKRIRNVALLVEDTPSREVRKKEGLGEGMLLGIYQGVPLSERGEGYGSLPTLPDTITIYRLPTLDEAEAIARERLEAAFSDLVRHVVRDTLWHEVGHYFGHDEAHMALREDEGSNEFKRL